MGRRKSNPMEKHNDAGSPLKEEVVQIIVSDSAVSSATRLDDYCDSLDNGKTPASRRAVYKCVVDPNIQQTEVKIANCMTSNVLDNSNSSLGSDCKHDGQEANNHLGERPETQLLPDTTNGRSRAVWPPRGCSSGLRRSRGRPALKRLASSALKPKVRNGNTVFTAGADIADRCQDTAASFTRKTGKATNGNSIESASLGKCHQYHTRLKSANIACASNRQWERVRSLSSGSVGVEGDAMRSCFLDRKCKECSADHSTLAYGGSCSLTLCDHFNAIGNKGEKVKTISANLRRFNRMIPSEKPDFYRSCQATVGVNGISQKQRASKDANRESTCNKQQVSSINTMIDYDVTHQATLLVVNGMDCSQALDRRQVDITITSDTPKDLDNYSTGNHHLPTCTPYKLRQPQQQHSQTHRWREEDLIRMLRRIVADASGSATFRLACNEQFPDNDACREATLKAKVLLEQIANYRAKACKFSVETAIEYMKWYELSSKSYEFVRTMYGGVGLFTLPSVKTMRRYVEPFTESVQLTNLEAARRSLWDVLEKIEPGANASTGQQLIVPPERFNDIENAVGDRVTISVAPAKCHSKQASQSGSLFATVPLGNTVVLADSSDNPDVLYVHHLGDLPSVT